MNCYRMDPQQLKLTWTRMELFKIGSTDHQPLYEMK